MNHASALSGQNAGSLTVRLPTEVSSSTLASLNVLVSPESKNNTVQKVARIREFKGTDLAVAFLVLATVLSIEIVRSVLRVHS